VFGIEQKADIDMKKMWGVSTLTLRRAIALMPLAALAATIERAEAACDITSPVNTATITCSGTTTDANGTTGFGGPFDFGNTYNILSGASIIGTDIGLQFNNFGLSLKDAGSVNNNGTITGGAVGIDSGSAAATITNNGTISGTGANSVGIQNNATAVITNFGTISGTGDGLDLHNGSVTERAAHPRRREQCGYDFGHGPGWLWHHRQNSHRGE
jgi:hypothetical protein